MTEVIPPLTFLRMITQFRVRAGSSTFPSFISLNTTQPSDCMLFNTLNKLDADVIASDLFDLEDTI